MGHSKRDRMMGLRGRETDTLGDCETGGTARGEGPKVQRAKGAEGQRRKKAKRHFGIRIVWFRLGARGQGAKGQEGEEYARRERAHLFSTGGRLTSQCPPRHTSARSIIEVAGSPRTKNKGQCAYYMTEAAGSPLSNTNGCRPILQWKYGWPPTEQIKEHVRHW